MKLAELLNPLLNWPSQLEVTGLSLDSRQIETGNVFIALNGAKQHGMAYAAQAVERGAIAVIYEPDGWDGSLVLNAEVVPVKGLAKQLGWIAAKFFDHPSQKLAVVGITGTNGKTSCSQLIAQGLDDCGVIGTLGWGEVGQLQPTLNTTPDALAVQTMLQHFKVAGKTSVAMEVSSHGLEQGRVNGVDFTGAVFTNFSRDHLDYHGSMDAYFQAKLGLFDRSGLQYVVVNLDDAKSVDLLSVIRPGTAVWTFSRQGRSWPNANSLLAEHCEFDQHGISFEIRLNQHKAKAFTSLVGAFNLENVLAVLAVLLASGIDFAEAVARLSHLKPIPGRMERFGNPKQPTVLVDYAHTPDALEKVLKSVKSAGQVWLVFGCGGNRDQGKRPQMGQIAETWADRVIITDDNPRDEVPQEIINQILAGCSSNKCQIINDRALAIATAIKQAQAQDWIVIAGKGHENYQEIHGIKWPFSDQDLVKQALATWGQ